MKPLGDAGQDLDRRDHDFVVFAFIVFAIFGLFPLLFTAWVSLHDWSLLGSHTWVGLDNYRELFGDEYFYNALGNTLGMFVLATVPQLIAALAPLRPLFIEEPMPVERVEALAQMLRGQPGGGAPVAAGQRLTLQGRSVLVLRQTR